jgi:hypothetical protein
MSKLSPSGALGFLLPERGHGRIYGLAQFINTFGFGLIMTAMTLYFTRVVHLSTEQVGIGLTIAGAIGLVAGIPVGDFADRRGPREAVRVTLLFQVAVTLSYVFVNGFAAFLVVASLEMLALSAYGAATGALMGRVAGANAAAFRSKNRAISNLGMSLGALGCAAALVINTPNAYRTLIVLNALTFLGSWAVLGRLPKYAPAEKPPAGPRWVALRDMPFVAYSAVAGILSMQYWVITGPLPLWVIDHTDAPRWCVPMFLLLNTGIIVLFQVRVGKSIESVRQGGIALRRAGVVFLLSCSVIGFAAGLPAWAALLLLVAGGVLHTFGEMLFAAGSFTVDFGLAPAHAQGQYMGLAGLGTGAGAAVAPVILIGLCLSFGTSGWVGLGVLFLLLGLAVPALTQWGERTRPVDTGSTSGLAQNAELVTADVG